VLVAAALVYFFLHYRWPILVSTSPVWQGIRRDLQNGRGSSRKQARRRRVSQVHFSRVDECYRDVTTV